MENHGFHQSILVQDTLPDYQSPLGQALLKKKKINEKYWYKKKK